MPCVEGSGPFYLVFYDRAPGSECLQVFLLPSLEKMFSDSLSVSPCTSEGGGWVDSWINNVLDVCDTEDEMSRSQQAINDVPSQWSEVEMHGKLIENSDQFIMSQMTLMQCDLHRCFDASDEMFPKSSPPWIRFWDEAPLDARGKQTALRGSKLLTPPRNYPLSQTQIHPYPGILRENYPSPPVPVKNF